MKTREPADSETGEDGAPPVVPRRVLRSGQLVMIALGFAALIAMTLVSVILAQRNREAFALASHTQAVLSDTNRSVELIEDAETGQRGFLLTEREAYLEPYNSAIGTAPDRLDLLVAETAGLPIAADAERLRAAGKEMLAELKDTLELYRSDGRGAALSEVMSDRGKHLMDQVRAVAATIRTNQERQLLTRLEIAGRTGRIMEIAQIGTALLVVIISLFTGAGFYRNIRALRLAQGDLAAANANLEKIVEARTAALLESRDRLAALLEQKTALLHEVGHRVSNSLQLISSLISIQAARISDPAARDALLQARERVQAVMLVHRRLYTSDEVGSIEIDKYLEAMAEELQASVLATEQGHRIVVEAAPLRIPTDKAISVGVIVNELITNALKYAFPDGKGGTIRIGLDPGDDDHAVLTVEDDGVGYSDSAAPKGTGLGTLIIGAMAKTLQGSVERQPTVTGSRAVLSFPTGLSLPTG